MMEEVANGVILSDLKNLDFDRAVQNMKDSRLEDKNIDKGLLGKFISIKINKLKGQSAIKDKDG